MKLRVQRLHPAAVLPAFAYKGDAGLDLHSVEDVDIGPGEQAVVGIGLMVKIPEGYAGFVWDKSGLAANHRITTVAGVIDSGYRGEVRVILVNHGERPYQIRKGDKVAQLVVLSVPEVEIEEGEVGEETERRGRGFGSSGR